MHNDDWHNGMWSDGSGWWMAIVMVVVVVVVAWVVVTLVRQNGRTAPAQPFLSPQATAGRPTPQEILAERLARGEIEPQEYQSRLSALTATPK